ncbi:hypothetical protein U9M48_037241 [Paspalum notatum var. saurae]|uniref:Uncharacterized protein n=1 Tax=Paspalum notatum var. saurae TaxID=547442 RepID=A0AAQ3UEJ1_PASNO
MAPPLSLGVALSSTVKATSPHGAAPPQIATAATPPLTCSRKSQNRVGNTDIDFGRNHES